MKFCADCKYFKGTAARHECDAPQNLMPPNLVDGTRLPRWSVCETLRNGGWFNFYKCGVKGRWFQPKDAAP